MDGRIRLRQWLEDRLNSGYIPGLVWLDKAKGIFKIPWKHHSKHTWHEDDAAIFKDWAVVTGRYREGLDPPDWPMWKTRLRCALNKAPDIEEARQHHNLHCDEPFKVYRFVSRTESVWRANASRHASLIFDGASPQSQITSSVQQISPPSNHQNTAQQSFQVTPFNHPPHPVTVTNSTTIKPVSYQPIQTMRSSVKHPIPQIKIIRKSQPAGRAVTLKYISLSKPLGGTYLQNLPSSLVTRRLYPNSNNQQTNHINNNSNIIKRNLIAPSRTPNYYSQSSVNNNVNRPVFSNTQPLSTVQSSLKLTNIIEPELHQICLRIQHLEHRVSDMIINNPHGCCIYFGKLDETLSSSGPEPIEPQLQNFVCDTDRYCVDMLLENMARGVLLSTEDGSLYAEKLCKCATFVYRPRSTSNNMNGGAGEFELVYKLSRRKRLCVFDYRAFIQQLHLYQQGACGASLPSCELVFAFGQQIREETTDGLGSCTSPESLYVWCRVASCKAWFMMQKNGIDPQNPIRTNTLPLNDNRIIQHLNSIDTTNLSHTDDGDDDINIDDEDDDDTNDFLVTPDDDDDDTNNDVDTCLDTQELSDTMMFSSHKPNQLIINKSNVTMNEAINSYHPNLMNAHSTVNEFVDNDSSIEHELISISECLEQEQPYKQQSFVRIANDVLRYDKNGIVQINKVNKSILNINHHMNNGLHRRYPISECHQNNTHDSPQLHRLVVNNDLYQNDEFAGLSDISHEVSIVEEPSDEVDASNPNDGCDPNFDF